MFLEFPKTEYYQWDTGQAVKLTADAAELTEVHMWNDRIGGPAMVQPIIEGENGRYVEIPDILFIKAGRIILWGVVSGEHGCCTHTEHDAINVLARAKPTDYAPGKVETLYYKELLEAIEQMKHITGDKGDSAYEVAVKQGFEGSEEEWLASLAGASVWIREITIPVSGWAAAEDDADYAYVIDVALEGTTDRHYPSVTIHPQSLRVAESAELYPVVQTIDGALRFRAKRIPTADMTATAVLSSQDSESGSSAAGDGSQPATEEEVDEMLDEVFSS